MTIKQLRDKKKQLRDNKSTYDTTQLRDKRTNYKMKR